MYIIISNDQKKTRLNLKRLYTICNKAALACGFCKRSFFSVIFVSKKKIRALNRRFFRKDACTDVIALAYKNRKNKKIFCDYAGDIAICTDVARENARLYKNNFLKELTLCLVHGILHLKGFDDTCPLKRRLMYKAQERILKKI